MKRNIVAVIVLLFFAASVPVFSTGQKEESETGEINLTVFCHFTPQEARGIAIRKFIEQYNQEKAGEIKVELSYFADFQPMQQKIRTMVSAKQPPDIFYFNYNPNDPALFQSGQLMDFSSYMDDAWKSRFYQSDLNALTYNGELLAIPMEQGPVVFYYNLDVLEAAGVSEIPETWDDFFLMAEKLKASGVAAASLFTADDAWHSMNLFFIFCSPEGRRRWFSLKV